MQSKSLNSNQHPGRSRVVKRREKSFKCCLQECSRVQKDCLENDLRYPEQGRVQSKPSPLHNKQGSRFLDLIKGYRQKIEKELENICNDVLHLLDDPLIPNSKNAEAKVFFLKMKGDYYRYLGEFLSGDK